MEPNLLNRLVAFLLVPCLMMEPITVMASIGPVGAGLVPAREIVPVGSHRMACHFGPVQDRPLQLFASQALAPGNAGAQFGRGAPDQRAELNVIEAVSLTGLPAAVTIQDFTELDSENFTESYTRWLRDHQPRRWWLPRGWLTPRQKREIKTFAKLLDRPEAIFLEPPPNLPEIRDQMRNGRLGHSFELWVPATKILSEKGFSGNVVLSHLPISDTEFYSYAEVNVAGVTLVLDLLAGEDGGLRAVPKTLLEEPSNRAALPHLTSQWGRWKEQPFSPGKRLTLPDQISHRFLIFIIPILVAGLAWGLMHGNPTSQAPILQAGFFDPQLFVVDGILYGLFAITSSISSKRSPFPKGNFRERLKYRNYYSTVSQAVLKREPEIAHAFFDKRGDPRMAAIAEEFASRLIRLWDAIAEVGGPIAFQIYTLEDWLRSYGLQRVPLNVLGIAGARELLSWLEQSPHQERVREALQTIFIDIPDGETPPAGALWLGQVTREAIANGTDPLMQSELAVAISQMMTRSLKTKDPAVGEAFLKTVSEKTPYQILVKLGLTRVRYENRDGVHFLFVSNRSNAKHASLWDEMLVGQGYPTVLGLNLPSTKGRLVLLPQASFALLTDDQREFVIQHEILEARLGSHFAAVEAQGFDYHNAMVAAIRARLLIQTIREHVGGPGNRPYWQRKLVLIPIMNRTTDLLGEHVSWLSRADRWLIFNPIAIKASHLVPLKEISDALIEAMARQLVNEVVQMDKPRARWLPRDLGRRLLLPDEDKGEKGDAQPKSLVRTAFVPVFWVIAAGHASGASFGIATILFVLSLSELSLLLIARMRAGHYPLIEEFRNLPEPSRPWRILENRNGQIRTVNQNFMSGIPPWLQRLYLRREQHPLQRLRWQGIEIGDLLLHLFSDVFVIPASFMLARHLDNTEHLIDWLRTNKATLTAELRKALLEGRMDGLTSLLTRKALNEEGARLISLAQRDGLQSLSLIMFDGDYFKGVNDNYGHTVGDEVLQYIAQKAKEAAKRPEDVVARYGGEEFVIMLPGANLEDAKEIAEKLRQAVETHLSQIVPLQKDQEDRPITISVGVASYQKGDKLKSLIERADEAVYAAKDGGRNQVVAAETSPPVHKRIGRPLERQAA